MALLESEPVDSSQLSESRTVSIRNLLSESAIYGIAKIVDPAIGFCLLPIVTAILQPADYGLIGFFTATSAVVFTVVSLGIHQSFLRFFTEATDTDNQREVAGSAISLSLIYWAIALPLGLYFAEPIAAWWFETPRPTLVYVLLALALIETLDALGCNLLQASGRAWSFLAATLINTVAVRMFALTLILWGAGAWGWITGEAFGRLIAMAAILWMAMPGVRLKTTKARAKTMSHYGVMLVPAMLSFYVMTITDKFLIQRLTENSYTEIGYYMVGERIAAIMHLTNYAIILAWQRFAFRNMHEDDGGKLIGYGLFLYCVGAGFVVTGLALLGDDLMHWTIDSKFAPGLPIIVPLTLAAFIGGLANLCDIGLHKRKWPHVISIVTTVAAIFNIGLNIAVIPTYGIQGAAWATFVSQALRLIMIYVASQWAFFIPVQVGRTLMLAILYGGIFALGKLAEPWGMIVAGGVQVVLMATTPLLLWRLPIWTDDERATVRNASAKLIDRLPRRMRPAE